MAQAVDGPLQQAAELVKRRRHMAADAVLRAAPAWIARTPAWALMRGVVHTRLGQIEPACKQLLPLTRGPEPWASEALAALADIYHFTHQLDALRALLAESQAWAATPRGRLFAARLLQVADPAQALAGLLALVDAPVEPSLQRIAGFDAVKLLDKQARYREAYGLATRLHARSPAFDLSGFLASLRLQQRLLGKGRGWCQPRVDAVAGTAFIVGLPRSGTTLLEQMLDSHPDVAGIGEHEGVADLAGSLISAGVWPYRLSHLPVDAATVMQQQYLSTARRRAARSTSPSPTWTLDKSLMTWRWLPALAAVLPGAVALQVVRDPRDTAISTHLSYLDPMAFGWTASLDAIRQVISAERELVPLALHTLELPHETLVYEDVVADPRSHLQRCLDRLALPMDERVLAPERNTRTAMTLSHEQVRRPVNDASIGRWQRYEFAFDSSWKALADRHAAHAAQRRQSTPA
jgi:hypothetical protein